MMVAALNDTFLPPAGGVPAKPGRGETPFVASLLGEQTGGLSPAWEVYS